jgi:hypothetical protein
LEEAPSLPEPQENRSKKEAPGMIKTAGNRGQQGFRIATDSTQKPLRFQGRKRTTAFQGIGVQFPRAGIYQNIEEF